MLSVEIYLLTTGTPWCILQRFVEMAIVERVNSGKKSENVFQRGSKVDWMVFIAQEWMLVSILVVLMAALIFVGKCQRR